MVADKWAQRSRRAAEKRANKLEKCLRMLREIPSDNNMRVVAILRNLGWMVLIGITNITLLSLISLSIAKPDLFGPSDDLTLGFITAVVMLFIGIFVYIFALFDKYASTEARIVDLQKRIDKLREKVGAAD
jgi:hypothetical protein